MAAKKGAKKSGGGKGGAKKGAAKKSTAKKGAAKKGAAKKSSAKKSSAGKGGAASKAATGRGAEERAAGKSSAKKATAARTGGTKKGGAKKGGKKSGRKAGGGVAGAVVGAVTGAAGRVASTATDLVRSAAEVLGITAPQAAAEGVPGQCLSLMSSGEIVEDAVRRAAPGVGTVDFAKTLEEHGIFTDGQRTVFRQDVFDRVHDRGCQINMGEIPNDADSVLQDIRTTIKARAR